MSIMYPILCNDINIYTGKNKLEKIALIFNLNNVEKQSNIISTTVRQSLNQIETFQRELKRVDTPVAAEIRDFLLSIKTKINCFKDDTIISLNLGDLYLSCNKKEDFSMMFEKLSREIEIVPDFINMVKTKKYRVPKNQIVFDNDKEKIELTIKNGFINLFNSNVLLVENLDYKFIDDFVYEVLPLVIKIDDENSFKEKLKQNNQIELINQHYCINSNQEKFIICDYVIKKEKDYL